MGNMAENLGEVEAAGVAVRMIVPDTSMINEMASNAFLHYMMHPAQKFAEEVLIRTAGSDRCDGLAGQTLELKDIVLNGEPLAYLCVGYKGLEEAYWVFQGILQAGLH